MYAGHAALALLAKGKRPRLPVWLLVPVAFAPDWIEWFLEGAGRENRELSHSLISVAIGATTVALGYWLVTRQRGDAVVLWLLYASHWAADFITGSKPTWPGGPTVGLVLYDRALWDCVLECLVIVGCWSVYRRSFSERAKRSALMVAMPLGLIALQVAFEAIQNPDIRTALRGMP